MSLTPIKVLFLCKNNTARSIMAETILNRLGQGRFQAFSAGSHPAGKIHDYTADLLKNLNYNLDTASSKPVDAINEEMDFIFTVCDQTALEDCPAFAGHPMTANWAVPDPLNEDGNEAQQRLAFSEAYRMLYNRIDIFVNLPLHHGDQARLQSQLDQIGK